MMSLFVDGWKHVRLMTDPRDSPVTSRRSRPLESKISMQRGLFILPEQKISISGCHVAWKVVNQRPGGEMEKCCDNEKCNLCEMKSISIELNSPRAPVQTWCIASLIHVEPTCFVVVPDTVSRFDRFATFDMVGVLGQIQAIGERRSQQALAAG